MKTFTKYLINKSIVLLLTIVAYSLSISFSFAGGYTGSAATTASTTSVFASETNREIIRVSVSAAAGGGSCGVSQLQFTMQNSDNADIANAKLYYTGTTSTFNPASPGTQQGSTITSPTGTITFACSVSGLSNTTVYFWLTFDIVSSPTLCNTVDAFVPANGLTITGTGSGTKTPTTPDPTGNRTLSGIGCWTYCSSNASNTTYSYISNVAFNSINNASTGCANYTDFTSISTTVSPSSSYDLTITKINDCTGGTPYTGRFAAWIDWNNDGDFADAGEQVLTDGSASHGPITASVSVPAGATIGTTRMRCIFREGATAPPYCGSYTSWGETEDYAINICGAATPTAPTTTGASRCGTGTVSLTASGAGGGFNYKWYDALTGGNLLQTDGSSFTTPSISTTTTYYVAIYNTATTCAISSRTSVVATVNSVPAVTVQPSNQSSCNTGNATFTLTATGTGLTYQWQEYISSWINITNGGIYSGALTNTLLLTGVTSGMNGYQYKCVVSGTCTPSATSNAVTLTVTAGTAPTTANAGPDQSVTATTATLAGNTPSVGTGAWSLISGTATITTPSSPTSGLTALAIGTATLRWTTTNGACTSTDDVVVTRYCLPGGGTASSSYLSNVTFEQINQDNTAWGGYRNYTTTASVSVSNTFVLSVTIYNATASTKNIAAWIDWNNNGVFTDAGEAVLSASSTLGTPASVLTTANVLVPTTTTTLTRMRVEMEITSANGPCNVNTYTDVQDYLVNILPAHCTNSAYDPSLGETATDCGGPCYTIVAGTVSGGGSFACGSGSFTLTLSGSTGSLQWQTSPNNSDPWYDIQGATGATYAGVTTQTSYYRVKVSGGNCTTLYTTVGAGSTVTITGTTTQTWTGATNTVWATATNWTPNGTPTSCSNVIIPDVANDPVVGAATSNCNNLVIDGGFLTVDLTGSNDFFIGGDFIVKNSGSLLHVHTTQNTTGSSNDLITLNGPSNYINMTGGTFSTNASGYWARIFVAGGANYTMQSDFNPYFFRNALLSSTTLGSYTFIMEEGARYDQDGTSAVMYMNTGTFENRGGTLLAYPAALFWQQGTFYTNYATSDVFTCIGADDDYYNIKIRVVSPYTAGFCQSGSCANNFEIVTGTTVNAGALNLTVGKSGNGTTGPNGNFINNGTFNAGTATVTMAGAYAQLITGSSSTTFNRLTINNTISGNGGVTINTPATVNSVLTLTDGHLISPASGRLTLGTASTVSPSGVTGSGSAASFVSGYLDRNFNAAITYDFPMGSSSSGFWRPASMTAKDATARTWSAQMIKTDPTTLGASYDAADLIETMNTLFYYNISRSPATGNIDLKHYYQDGDLIDESKSCIGHWTGTLWNSWNKDLAGDWARSTSNNWIQVLDVSTFSPTGPGDGSALPVELLYFDAKLDKNHVNLNWKTASEKNTSVFVVEKSDNILNFETIVSTIPASGNNINPLNYQAIDNSPLKGISYYRLKTVDMDGKFSISDIKTINNSTKFEIETIYPNPIDNTIFVKVNNPETNSNSITVKIVSIMGQLILTKNVNVDNGSSVIEINAENVGKGLYFVKIENNGLTITTEKFTKQ